MTAHAHSEQFANPSTDGTGTTDKFGLCIPVCSVPGCLFSPKCRYHGSPLCAKHFNIQYMRDKRPRASSTRYFLGIHGEAAVRQIFARHGRTIEDSPTHCRWDYVVDGYRVEVMTVNPRKSKPGWLVNFQRNGVLNEQADFYAIRLEWPFEPIHILIPAPVGKKGILITRSAELWQRRDDFNAFARGLLVPPKVQP